MLHYKNVSTNLHRISDFHSIKTLILPTSKSPEVKVNHKQLRKIPLGMFVLCDFYYYVEPQLMSQVVFKSETISVQSFNNSLSAPEVRKGP